MLSTLIEDNCSNPIHRRRLFKQIPVMEHTLAHCLNFIHLQIAQKYTMAHLWNKLLCVKKIQWYISVSLSKVLHVSLKKTALLEQVVIVRLKREEYYTLELHLTCLFGASRRSLLRKRGTLELNLTSHFGASRRSPFRKRCILYSGAYLQVLWR